MSAIGVRIKCGRFYSLSIRRLSTTANRLEAQPSYYHNVGKEPLRYTTVGQLFQTSTTKYEEREAIVSMHENKRLTFGQLREEVDKMAAAFIDIGLTTGDKIGICAPNYTYWYTSMMAAARAGLVVVAINPAYQIPELEYCINKVNLKAIIIPDSFKSQNYYEMLSKIMPELSNSSPSQIESAKCPSLKNVIVAGKKPLPGAFTMDEIVNLATPEQIQHIANIQFSIQPDACCNIQFTSGTTGKPKAAQLSHYSFVNNAKYIGIRNGLHQYPHRICVQVPFFHAFGITITILPALTFGSTLVLPSPIFNKTASLAAIVQEKCTTVHGTPTMYVDLVKEAKEVSTQLETLDVAVTGGSPCSPQLFKNIKEVLGVKNVKTVYGLTEITAVSHQTLPDETEDQTFDTVGFLQEHLEAKVIDSNGAIVNMGEAGELCIRGYSTMLGYYNDPEKTKETLMENKWLHTGDQFVMMGNGYGKIVGRIKDMIIRGGENLFPKEIEDFLNTHPDVLEAHVIGVPDERMGEEVCGVVRLKAGRELTVNDVKTFSKGKIAHFKVPKYIQIVDDFPKTISGKVQKFKLKLQTEHL